MGSEQEAQSLENVVGPARKEDILRPLPAYQESNLAGETQQTISGNTAYGNQQLGDTYAPAIISAKDRKLQQNYATAIMKRKPGLSGDKCELIARELINSGLEPSQALALINLVYTPTDVKGRGQATRLKYFSAAIVDAWGDRLANASQHFALFRGMIAQISDAIQLRDKMKDEDKSYGISFREALLFQEIGLESEYFFGLAETLVSEFGISRVAATMRIKEAAKLVRARATASLEGILFPQTPSEFNEENDGQ